MNELSGQLLVAGGGLFDPNFRQTVVLVAHHSEEGAFGIVLNRPSPMNVEEAAPQLAALVGAGQTLFLGGPVEPGGALVLAEFAHPELAEAPVFGSIGFVTAIHEQRPTGVVRARAFAGHAGWGPGQLEGELTQEAWIVEPAQVDDVFSDDPKKLWSAVLRRKGPSYALLSLMPFDPRTN